VVASPAEIGPLLERVQTAAACTAQMFSTLVASRTEPLELLRQFKFQKIGRHPLEHRELNFIEQVNQTWTCLVTLNALQFLFDRHTDAAGGFRLNLCARSGTDILSVVPDLVAAETFAAVSWSNNRKGYDDLNRLATSSARYRYVFFAAPGIRHERQLDLERPGIEVWGINV
jgi:hypothetical protein